MSETERRRAKTLENSKFLPIGGRSEINEELPSALAAEQDKLPVIDQQLNALDRRLKAYALDGNTGRLASEVIAEIRRRRGSLK